MWGSSEWRRAPKKVPFFKAVSPHSSVLAFSGTCDAPPKCRSSSSGGVLASARIYFLQPQHGHTNECKDVFFPQRVSKGKTSLNASE